MRSICYVASQSKTSSVVALMMAIAGATACGAGIDEDSEHLDQVTAADGEYTLATWNATDRTTWYTTPQGSQLLDYRLFRALETADGARIFTTRANLESFGFVYPPPRSSVPTFEGLPIGVVKDTDAATQKEYVGLTCPACHTGQVDYAGKRMLVEAGQGSFDFEGFATGLAAAIDATERDPAKFDRFCGRLADATDCKAQLDEAQAKLAGLVARNHSAVLAGPGRLDAFGIILNELFASELAVQHPLPADSPDTVRDLVAPVSYPAVWDAPRRYCVQTNCATHDPMTRNIGEVMGAFGSASLGPTGVVSSANAANLYKLERALATLGSPKWDPRVFGAIDAAKAARGEAVYAASCASCHARPDQFDPAVLAADPTQADTLNANFVTEVNGGVSRYYDKVTEIPVQAVGTDPSFTVSHTSRFTTNPAIIAVFDGAVRATVQRQLAAAGITDPAVIEAVFAQTKAGQLAAGIRRADGGVMQLYALGAILASTLQTSIAQAVQADPTIDPVALANQYTNFRIRPSVALTNYGARPLDGIAFTAPYGHNGAWPTLRDVLAEPSQRRTSFPVRTGAFDPVNVGLDVNASCPRGTFVFDTTIPGNGNGGHTYGTNLAESDKDDLLEFLKTL